MTDMPTVETPRIPVTTTYHGVEVTDDYRWLEDATGEGTAAWSEAQAQRTRDYVASLPFHGKLRVRVAEVLTGESSAYTGLCGGGSTCFAAKHQPPNQQPFLVALTDLDDHLTS